VRDLAEWLQATPLSVTLQSVSWIIPLLQSIHIVTIGVVFVSSLMIMLRVLGRMRADEPFAEIWARFAPWMWSGLAVMAVTGVTLLVAEPVREVSSLSFWIKMVLVAIAVASTSLFARSSGEFSMAARSGAVALVLVWLAIIFLGRAIAYDLEVWGRLSPHS
jgi:hypothetical protein